MTKQTQTPHSVVGVVLVLALAGVLGALNDGDILQRSGGQWVPRAYVQPAAVVITYTGTNVVTDASLGTSFRVTLTNNATLTAPSGLVDNTVYSWQIKQGAGAPYTLALASVFLPPPGYSGLTLTNAVNGVNEVCGRYVAGSSPAVIRLTGNQFYSR